MAFYQFVVAPAVSGAVAYRAFRKQQLTPAASVVAWCIGSVVSAAGPAHLTCLLTFFLSSSRITKLGKEKKKKVDPEYHAAGLRTVSQVLCNGGCAAALFIVSALFRDRVPFSPALQLAAIGHFAACQGDTWSSEIGVLSSTPPRLIVGFRKVPAGTNGGVTLLGTAAAVAGGLVLGCAVVVCHVFFPIDRSVSAGKIVWTCVEGAILGTVVDSVLGQFLQLSIKKADGSVASTNNDGTGERVSGIDLLSNNAVNLVSSAVVAAVTFWMNM